MEKEPHYQIRNNRMAPDKSTFVATTDQTRSTVRSDFSEELSMSASGQLVPFEGLSQAHGEHFGVYHQVPVGVSVLLWRESTSFLLVQRGDVSFAPGYWTLPGGHLEAGEGLDDAGQRELAEETGVCIGLWELRPLLLQRTREENVGERLEVFFETQLPDSTEPQLCEPDKVVDLAWSTMDDLPRPIVPNVAAALKAIDTNSRQWYTSFDFSNPNPPPNQDTLLD